ncbi:MAG: putative quorum-sensing-regulated virulence factor, partial [Kangiellaceae bacterium]
MYDPENLKKIATTKMPFGKYKGRFSIDLPEPYTVWFGRQ